MISGTIIPDGVYTLNQQSTCGAMSTTVKDTRQKNEGVKEIHQNGYV
jgi:hypothetical protein